MTNPAWTQTEIVIRTDGYLSICFIVICTQTVICSSVSLLYFFIHSIIYSFILYSDYFALIGKGHFVYMDNFVSRKLFSTLTGFCKFVSGNFFPKSE